MVSELISSMNDVTDVNGMLYTSLGWGVLAGDRPRYSRYVEMNAPKKMHSDDRNTHIANLTLVAPVLVSACPCTTCRVVVGPGVVQRRALELGLGHRQSSAVPGSSVHAKIPNRSTITPGIASHGFLKTAA